MQRLAQFIFILLLLMMTFPASARVRHSVNREMQKDAGAGFGEILDLWRNGNYEDLWRRTTGTGRQSKESFFRRLEAAARKPACCWEMLQDVTVTAKDDHKAVVQAKVGLEGVNSSTEFVTGRFKMVNEDGLWKISASDILSLAENGKKKAHRRSTGKKQNITIYPSP